MHLDRYRPIDLSLVLIVAVSSFLFSGLPFYPFLTSDLAIQVYMTESFEFPRDLYFWGQDRLGSIVPMLGHTLVVLTGLAPIWACSLAETFLNLAGALAAWQFISNRPLRLLFTLLWFFPTYEMRYLILPSHPYGEQLTFLLLAIIFFRRSLNEFQALNWVGFLLCAVISVWISDLSILFLLPLPLFFFKEIKTLRIQLGHAQFGTWLVVSALFLAASAYVLLTIKSITPKEYSITNQIIATSEEFVFTISKLGHYFTQTIFVRSASTWDSLMLFSFLILAQLLRYFKFKLSNLQRYFLWTGLLTSIALLPLHWIAANDVMLKYFIPSFYFIFLSLFSMDVSGWKTASRNAFQLLCTTFVLGGSLSCLSIYQTDYDTRLSYGDLEPIRTLAPISFMGNYWHSYVLGIADPGHIKVAPRDDGTIRNRDLLAEVLSSDTIYLVSNDWLNEFPDTVVQYRHALLLSGSPKQVGRYRLAPYRVIKSD